MRQATVEFTTGHRTKFHGGTYSTELDCERVSGQFARVRSLMEDGEWRMLREIAAAVGGSGASVSAVSAMDREAGDNGTDDRAVGTTSAPSKLQRGQP